MPTYDRVVCQIPGSTSNCGSGFDTLGLALAVHNRVEVARSGSGQTDFGPDIVPLSEMTRDTVAAFFAASEVAPLDVEVRIQGEVPQARGLGSSITVRGGIVLGLSILTGVDWDRERIVAFLTELEGHPDNASAAILGGFTVSRFAEDPAQVEAVAQFEIGPELRFAVVSPDYEVLTSSSRKTLPDTIPFKDVIRSINGTSVLVAALASGQFDGLTDAVNDHVHEPYRLAGIPGGRAAIDAGVAAGAYTGWLSGSGSSVLCTCTADTVEAVLAAMQAAFRDAGLESVARDLSADNAGAVILEKS